MRRCARAAVFVAPGQPLALREFAAPEPRGGELLVRVTACTLCASDLHTFHGRRPGAAPSILGHEILGTIAAFGPEAPRQDHRGQRLREGDRITWTLAASCGGCFFCARRLPQKCRTLHKYGHEPLRPGRELSGGLAEHCLLEPGTALFRVADALADGEACPANCATATVAAALRAAGELRGAQALVLGAGMLGTTAVAMGASRGAEVTACDAVPARAERARQFGAARAATPASLPDLRANDGHGFDVCLDFTGAPEAFEAAFPRVRAGGRYVCVGNVCPQRPVAINLEDVVRRHVDLRGVYNYGPDDLADALAFLESNRAYPLASMVGAWFPLERANDAFLAAADPAMLRVGVRP